MSSKTLDKQGDILATDGFEQAERPTSWLLHDATEKTGATYDDVARECEAEVATMVATLSKDHRLPDAEAERAYHEQLRAADWKTRLIKLTDDYDNLCDAGYEHAKRVRIAQLALSLATDTEPSMVRARRILGEAIANCGEVSS